MYNSIYNGYCPTLYGGLPSSYITGLQHGTSIFCQSTVLVDSKGDAYTESNQTATFGYKSGQQGSQIVPILYALTINNIYVQRTEKPKFLQKSLSKAPVY